MREVEPAENIHIHLQRAVQNRIIYGGYSKRIMVWDALSDEQHNHVRMWIDHILEHENDDDFPRVTIDFMKRDHILCLIYDVFNRSKTDTLARLLVEYAVYALDVDRQLAERGRIYPDYMLGTHFF